MSITRPAVIRTGVAATLAFAAAHVYWALGGTAGLPTGTPITGRPVFLAYDVASAVVLVVAAGIALRLTSAPTRRLTRWTVVGASIALVRGLVGLVQDAALVAGGHHLTLGAGYDVWFAAVGALFLAVGLTDRTGQSVGGTTRTRASRPSMDAAIVNPRFR